jgi:hypothetical protein
MNNMNKRTFLKTYSLILSEINNKLKTKSNHTRAKKKEKILCTKKDDHKDIFFILCYNRLAPLDG